METTVFALVSALMRRSRTVYGLDLQRLANKQTREADEPDYANGENDIHRLFRYVREITAYGLPDMQSVRNFAAPFALKSLSLRRKYCKQQHDSCLGLYSRQPGGFADELLPYCGTEFVQSLPPELQYGGNVIDHILQCFSTTGVYCAAYFSYLTLLAQGILPYEPECFRNCWLIDVSESPDDVEAISHFDLRVQNGTVRMVASGSGETLDVLFSRLLAHPDYAAGLKRRHRGVPAGAVQTAAEDIRALLMHF